MSVLCHDEGRWLESAWGAAGNIDSDRTAGRGPVKRRQDKRRGGDEMDGDVCTHASLLELVRIPLHAKLRAPADDANDTKTAGLPVAAFGRSLAG